MNIYTDDNQSRLNGRIYILLCCGRIEESHIDTIRERERERERDRKRERKRVRKKEKEREKRKRESLTGERCMYREFFDAV